MAPPDDQEEQRLRDELDEREVEGLETLPREDRDDVVESARRNPDRTTRREAIEQELMEQGNSEAGTELGD